MIHPDTELQMISSGVGYGLVATRSIPRGTITWTLDALDRVLAPSVVARLGTQWTSFLEKYTFVDRRGWRVLCWDLGRYMNHSCDFNSLSPGLNLEIAVRDIAAGEELTCDYGALNLERDFDCECGSPGCRGVIRTDDFDRHTQHWDAQLAAAFGEIERVPQPVLPWVRPDDLDALRNAQGSGGAPSIALHRWKPDIRRAGGSVR